MEGAATRHMGCMGKDMLDQEDLSIAVEVGDSIETRVKKLLEKGHHQRPRQFVQERHQLLLGSGFGTSKTPRVSLEELLRQMDLVET